MLRETPKDKIIGANVYGYHERWVYARERREIRSKYQLQNDREWYYFDLRNLRLQLEELKKQHKECKIELEQVIAEMGSQPTSKKDGRRKKRVSTMLPEGILVDLSITKAKHVISNREKRLRRMKINVKRRIDVMLSAHAVRKYCIMMISRWWLAYKSHRVYNIVEQWWGIQRKRVKVSEEAYWRRFEIMFCAKRKQRLNDCATHIVLWWRGILDRYTYRLYKENKAACYIAKFIQTRIAIYQANSLRKTLSIERCICVRQARRDRFLSSTVFTAWIGYMEWSLELKHKQNVAKEQGKALHVQWSAKLIQRQTRKVLYRHREALQEELYDHLHPQLAKRIDELSYCIYFFSELKADARTRVMPTAQERRSAARYGFPLQSFPIESTLTWLELMESSFINSERVLCPDQPLTKGVLRFLIALNEQYWNYQRFETQLHQVHERSEVISIVKSYMMHLAKTNRISSNQRPQTVASTAKRPLNALRNTRSHYLKDIRNPERDARLLSDFSLPSTSYSQFHSSFSDLCSHCLEMIPHEHSSPWCPTCQHPTFARDSISSKGTRGSRSEDGVFHFTEPCDYLVIHAFFHTLAPYGHPNRLLPVAHVWSSALTQSTCCIRALHDHGVESLQDLLRLNESKQLRLIEFPSAVAEKLDLMLKYVRDEMNYMMESYDAQGKRWS